MRALAFAFVLSACGAPVYSRSPVIVQDAAADSDDRLIDYAVAGWASIGLPVYVGEGAGSFPVHFHDTPEQVSAACKGVSSRGCSKQGRDGTRYAIHIRRQSAKAMRTTLLHEIGHMLRGWSLKPHLDCNGDVPGPDVMCPSGASPGVLPTPRDVDFVTEAP